MRYLVFMLAAVVVLALCQSTEAQICRRGHCAVAVEIVTAGCAAVEEEVAGCSGHAVEVAGCGGRRGLLRRALHRAPLRSLVKNRREVRRARRAAR